MRELLAELTAALDQGRACVWCSVVETRGSTPQKAGAAMLVFPDGSQRGTLGGGCVEAEVKQRALGVLANGGRSEVLTFCLDDNYGWDDGLICGGRMTILADPVKGAAGYYRRFRELVEAGRGCTEAVVFSDQAGLVPGSRYLFDADSRLVESHGNGTRPDEVARHLVPLQQRPRPSAQRGIAYLPVLPRITLLLVGGGHVGQAVARLAAEVDFDVWVLDDRAAYANPERFPAAKKLLVGDIGQTLKQLAQDEIRPDWYCLIVTRGHAHDEEALYHLAPLTLSASPGRSRLPDGTGPARQAGPTEVEESGVRGAGYVGLIGSKRKIRMIYEDLIAKGVPREALAKVHAPLGFAIGSQTVPEIAVSIVAELIACRNLGRTIPEARTHVSP